MSNKANATASNSRAKLGTRILCIVLSALMVGGLATSLVGWLVSIL